MTVLQQNKTNGKDSNLVIRDVSDTAKSITDGVSSITNRDNILEKELNLTEYEKMIRRQNGIISESDEKDSRIFDADFTKDQKKIQFLASTDNRQNQITSLPFSHTLSGQKHITAT